MSLEGDDFFLIELGRDIVLGPADLADVADSFKGSLVLVPGDHSADTSNL